MTFWFDGRNGNEVGAANGPGQASLSAGALLGWGVFTTLGIWQKRPFAVDRHLARLRHDAERARIVLDWEDANLAANLQTAVQESGIQDGIARITVARRGDGRWNSEPGSTITLALNTVSADARSKPVHLMLSPHRVEARRPLVGVKSTSYLDYQLTWLEASESGFDDALLCNSSGILCECSRSNLFWARGGVLFTPSDETGCLPGIGRSLVMEWAAQQGVEIRTGAFTPHELQMAEEVFITASTTGPRAVSQLQLATDWDLEWGEGGSLTKQLQQTWIQETTKPDA